VYRTIHSQYHQGLMIWPWILYTFGLRIFCDKFYLFGLFGPFGLGENKPVCPADNLSNHRPRSAGSPAGCNWWAAHLKVSHGSSVINGIHGWKI
jgi:hypothetical protein